MWITMLTHKYEWMSVPCHSFIRHFNQTLQVPSLYFATLKVGGRREHIFLLHTLTAYDHTDLRDSPFKIPTTICTH